MQTDLAITNNVATGTLNFIEDYTSAGFDMSQGNHFIALTVGPTVEGSTMTCTFNNKDIELDSDLTIVLQMTEAKKALDVVFTETVDDEVVATATIALSGLTLAEQ